MDPTDDARTAEARTGTARSSPSPPTHRGRPLHTAAAALAAAVGLAAAACGGDGGMGPGGDARGQLQCRASVDQSLIFDGGVGRGGIPALSSPSTSRPGGADLGFLDSDSRVFGVVTDDGAYAVPQNIMWWHEIVNVTLDGRELAITTCPLTGSTLAFSRDAVGGDELIVSGLLFFNNQVMSPSEAETASLWPQMVRGAACGPDRGTDLTQVPVLDMAWTKWRELFPETRVVNGETGFARNYDRYPYGNYDERSNSSTLGFPIGELDPRRPPKERVLGIPSGGFKGGGIALPFLELEDAAEADGGKAVVRVSVGGRDHVVFWETGARGAVAFDPALDGRDLTFAVRNGEFVDEQTGSTWRLDGLAVAGPLEGSRLQPRAEPFVAFWFAWAFFQPDTRIWEAPGSGG